MSTDFKEHLIFFFLFSIFTTASCSSGINSLKQNQPPFCTFKQRQFSVNDFHYLNVTRIGIFTSYDEWDCAFKCVRNTLCRSMNIAAAKGADGKLWCELLPSDKYRDAENYHENMTSHHFHVIFPSCFSSPCQNGGTCISNYNSYYCRCEKSFVGDHCEREIRSDVNELVTLRLDSKPVSVLCHMEDFGCGDGGWTPVLKIDGNKRTFHFNSPYWRNKIEHNLPGGKTGFDSQETKLPTYWNTSFSKICLGMKIGQQLRFIVINKQADSLYSLIADGKPCRTLLSRDTWKKLIGSQASLQLDCVKDGFNAISAKKKCASKNRYRW